MIIQSVLTFSKQVTRQIHTGPLLLPTVVNVRTVTDDIQNHMYIGRPVLSQHLPGSKWANPFKLSHGAEPGSTLKNFESYLKNRSDLLSALHELEGKSLMCWCAPKPCHGHVLRRLVATRCLDPWEMVLFFGAESSTFDWDDDSSPREPSKSLRCMDIGEHKDAIIIGVTLMRGNRRSVMAITSNGCFFHPVPEGGVHENDSLAVLYTKFDFSAAPPTTINLPHANDDVGVKNISINGKATHREVIRRMTLCVTNQKKASEFSRLLSHLHKSRYVTTGDDFPSTCIAKSDGPIKMYRDTQNNRIHADVSVFTGGSAVLLRLLVTSVAIRQSLGEKYELLFPAESVHAVCIGLARPFIPEMLDEDAVPRCYPMLVGLILKSKIM
jgi:hypothetical protein